MWRSSGTERWLWCGSSDSRGRPALWNCGKLYYRRTPMQDKIYIKGARENNLKNVDVEIPRDK